MGSKSRAKSRSIREIPAIWCVTIRDQIRFTQSYRPSMNHRNKSPHSHINLKMSLRLFPRIALRSRSPIFLARSASSSTPQPPVPLPEFQPKPSDPAEVHQSPNMPTTWSTSQNPKKNVFDGPRFEQTDLSLQPNSLSAMEMSQKDPIRMVGGRRASCDGGESG